MAAASSLADAFQAIEEAFEREYPTVDVELNLASSSALREQILAGSEPDVFASASATIVDELAVAGAITQQAIGFATNQIVLAVPIGNPAAVKGIDDLSAPSLLVGLCAEGVPCGDLAVAALASASVEPSVDTLEPNALALRTKIELGELDVGILYASDLVASEQLESVELPGNARQTASYTLAPISEPTERAQAFIDFVLSDQGLSILAEFGFGPP